MSERFHAYTRTLQKWGGEVGERGLVTFYFGRGYVLWEGGQLNCWGGESGNLGGENKELYNAVKNSYFNMFKNIEYALIG